MSNLIDTLKAALKKTNEDKKRLEFALLYLKKNPEVGKFIVKILSIMSSDYLIEIIKIITDIEKKND